MNSESKLFGIVIDPRLLKAAFIEIAAFFNGNSDETLLKTKTDKRIFIV